MLRAVAGGWVPKAGATPPLRFFAGSMRPPIEYRGDRGELARSELQVNARRFRCGSE
jgi:hypothetical protein